MEILTFVLGDLFVNTYLILNGEKGLIIDPASSDKDFLDKIPEIGIEYIVNTHGHFDHIAGNLLIKERFNSKIIVHKEDSSMLTHPELNFSIFSGEKIISPPPDIILDEKKLKLTLCDIEWFILNTPGHTKGSIILINEKERLIFAGDLIFEDSIGRTDLPSGNFNEMIYSLKTVNELPDDYFVYPGHGNSFYLKDFKSWLKGFLNEA